MDGIYQPPKPAIIIPRQPEIIRPGDPRFALPHAEAWAKRQSLTPGTLGVNAIGGKKRRRKIGGNDSFTKVLLHLNGADGATTFPDVNAGGSAHTWSAAGNAQIDTAQSLFGGSSLLLNGTGDIISMADHADVELGGQEFAIDVAVRFAALPTGTLGSGSGAFFASHWTSASRAWVFGVGFNGSNYNLAFLYNSAPATGSNISLSTGVWYRAAVSRDNTGTDTLRFFLDGAVVGTSTAIDGVTIADSTDVLSLGGAGAGGSYFNGWMNEFRLSVGTPRFTAAYTPAAGPYTTV